MKLVDVMKKKTKQGKAKVKRKEKKVMQDKERQQAELRSKAKEYGRTVMYKKCVHLIDMAAEKGRNSIKHVTYPRFKEEPRLEFEGVEARLKEDGFDVNVSVKTTRENMGDFSDPYFTDITMGTIEVSW